MFNNLKVYIMRNSRLSVFLLGAALLLPCLNVNAQYVDAETGVTYTAIEGSKDGNEGFQCASDGNTQTKYGTGDYPNYVVIEASEAVRLKGYTIITANDNEQCTNRNPKDWTLEGSNDKENWTLLAEVTDDETMQDVNYTPFDFALEKKTAAFKYFRFTVIAAQGATAYMQYSEIHLWGETATAIGNADELQAFAAAVNEGDVISLRGAGKGSVTGTGGTSRKGRLFVYAEILK